MKTITRNQAQSIIDIACGKWKGKLAEEWYKEMLIDGNVDITEEFYQEMRKACNAEQNVLFDKIFGKDVKYKVGDWVVFQVDECKGSLSHCKTDYWDRNVTLQIDKIDGNSLVFNSNQLKERAPHGDWSTSGGANNELLFRLATPEEIKKATCIPKGTPCFVRDLNEEWSLYYADGNGEFYDYGKRSGCGTTKWEHVRKYSDGLPEE